MYIWTLIPPPTTSSWSLDWLACIVLARLAIWNSISLFLFVFWTHVVDQAFIATNNIREEEFAWVNSIKGLQFITVGELGWQQYVPHVYWLEAASQDSEADTTSKTHGQRLTSPNKVTVPKKKSPQNNTTKGGPSIQTCEPVKNFPHPSHSTMCIFFILC